MANAHIRYFYREKGDLMFELVRERLLKRTNQKKRTKTIEKVKKWDRYIPVITKFIISHILSLVWLALSIYLSRVWVKDLAQIVTLPVAIFIVTGIAYIPGYLNAMMVSSLLLDRQPALKDLHPTRDVTILIAARNEGKRIHETLQYIAKQDYGGKIKVLVVDNNSTDDTVEKANAAGQSLHLPVRVLKEKEVGKFNALNTGLKSIDTDLMFTLDADTLLHKSAVRFLVARMLSAPKDVCAVAGGVLVRNSRTNIITRLQEWDYFLSIASIKRLQGLYQGTLVAQGAYSLYKTKAVRDAGGWPNAIGEDIVLTWNFLKKNKKVYYEPTAISFTEVPDTLKHLIRQRSRWARGMIEALKETKPWQQPNVYMKYLTGVDLVIPYLDLVYTFCWMPGLVLACFGIFWIVGPMTLLVLPLTFASYLILYEYQRRVFKKLDLRVRRNYLGFFIFIFCYQMLMSPISVWGYIQEIFGLDRIWS
jgi:biofilm PGA synthesis N-glycosyltransferase PgaC